MSVDIVELDPETDADEWNRYVERSPGTNPFHRFEALDRQAEETNSQVHLLAGFVGQEPVGLFPVFAVDKGPLTAAFSPPPYSWTSYLGPAMLNVTKLKRRKADRRTRRFIEGCLDWLDTELSPVYTKFVTGVFEDVRPFLWDGFDVQPAYTYVVDLEGNEDELMKQFSGDARRNVKGSPDDAYVIEEGGGDEVETIVEQVAARYERQDRPFHLSPSYARSLHDVLPDGALRPYVCRIEGETVGGILVAESGRTRYRWQGGVRVDVDVDVSVNDLLDWHVMRDGLRNGVDRYDLVGAGVPRINEYKSKFNPRLETHYTITRGKFGIDRVLGRMSSVS